MSFVNNMLDVIQRINTNYKLSFITPFFKKEERILDFGCGDLLLAKALFRNNPKLDITGVDVVDFGKRPKGIKFNKYDGEQLPFKSNSFDTVLAYHVLHHCDDPVKSFDECFRVAKKRLIIVEPIYRLRVEIPIMRFMDWLYNVWKSKSISMQYQFLSKRDWSDIFKQYRLRLQREIVVDRHPSWLPIGKTYLFVLKKSK